MSARLIKIIDFSLLPLALLLLGKVAGLALSFNMLGIQWGVVDFPGQLINVTPVVLGRDLHTVQTFSNFVMFIPLLVLISAQIYILDLRSKIDKNFSLLRRIITSPLEGVFMKSAMLFTRTLVWLCYLVLAAVYILWDTLQGNTSIFLGAAVLITTAGAVFWAYKEMSGEIADEELKLHVRHLHV